MKFPEQFRWADAPNGYHTIPGEPFGAFRISARFANGRCLNVIAADGQETGWEHVSVSLTETPNKCPSWDEMCVVKRLFWEGSDCVVQFHPRDAEYVNLHPGVLHLWRCVNAEFPVPPMICV